MNRTELANIITNESVVDYTKEETEDINVSINDCPIKLTKKQKDAIMSLLQ